MDEATHRSVRPDSNRKRIFAIGDIHGYLRALNTLLGYAEFGPHDRVIFLGDYVDKGPCVKGVIDRLLEFSLSHDSIFLRGNHDQMMLDAFRDPAKFGIWESLAGPSPLQSYGAGDTAALLSKVPSAHWDFLENRCRDHFETEEYIFVHAGIQPHRNPVDEDRERLQWSSLELAAPHLSGRTVVCGHTAQRLGKIADLGHTIAIDTGITSGQWLTCLALDTFEFWQANEAGEQRTGVLRERS